MSVVKKTGAIWRTIATVYCEEESLDTPAPPA
jgi:hypothetical protein